MFSDRISARDRGTRLLRGALYALLLLSTFLLVACAAEPTPAPQPVVAAHRSGPFPQATVTPARSATPTVLATPTPSPSRSVSRTSRPSVTIVPPTPTVTAAATAAATGADTLAPSPTATASPTLTETDTPTPAPTATATPAAPVYDAAFVADVTIPDGTTLAPGEPFTKTWRLRNTGNTPWDETTSLALAVGEAMGAPEAVPVPATAPGETADVSVPMVAPAAVGEHSAAWRLCRAEGCFGGAVTLQIVSRSALAVRGPAVELPPAEPAACNYIGNRNPTSMKFHRADCRWVQEMYEGNKVCFATGEEAVAAGYVPCKVCRP